MHQVWLDWHWTWFLELKTQFKKLSDGWGISVLRLKWTLNWFSKTTVFTQVTRENNLFVVQLQSWSICFHSSFSFHYNSPTHFSCWRVLLSNSITVSRRKISITLPVSHVHIYYLLSAFDLFAQNCAGKSYLWLPTTQFDHSVVVDGIVIWRRKQNSVLNLNFEQHQHKFIHLNG